MSSLPLATRRLHNCVALVLKLKERGFRFSVSGWTTEFPENLLFRNRQGFKNWNFRSRTIYVFSINRLFDNLWLERLLLEPEPPAFYSFLHYLKMSFRARVFDDESINWQVVKKHLVAILVEKGKTFKGTFSVISILWLGTGQHLWLFKIFRILSFLWFKK